METGAGFRAAIERLRTFNACSMGLRSGNTTGLLNPFNIPPKLGIRPPNPNSQCGRAFFVHKKMKFGRREKSQDGVHGKGFPVPGTLKVPVFPKKP
ncbi:hypothetical protein TNIN_94231 [Trichonephila inaurata madagascariensis]|uniref:Uncharacterized protein n=1 Tax=Trichonephila inaurata madagascariensis TaxID=2747483 RepID=A0A8X6WY99_9ARAC|nr:hypothetical protein TNIN_94231 [Trichonephila inaurata madagascariensis]